MGSLLCYIHLGRKRRNRWLCHMLILSIFAGLGFFRMDMEMRRVTAIQGMLPHSEQQIQLQGHIYKKEIKNDETIYYLNHVILYHEQQESTCRNTILYPSSDTYSIGTTIKATGTFIPLRGARNEGNYDEQKYYQSMNIDFKVQDAVITAYQAADIIGRISQRLYKLRTKIQQIYMQYLPGEESGVMSVIALGEKSNLDTEVKKLYQLAGLAHILAISGMHISVVGMGFYQILRKRGKGFILAGIVAWSMVFAYAWMSGMSVSAVRAVGMFGFMMMGGVLGEAYDSLTALEIVGGGGLLYHPYVFTSSGFLFSYGAVIGVMTVAIPLHKAYDRYCRQRRQYYYHNHREVPRIVGVREKIVDAFIMGTGIQLATLPMVAYFYYELPVYVIFLNLLLLPLLGVLLGCGIIGGLLGTVVATMSIQCAEISVMIHGVLQMIFLPCHTILYLYECMSVLSLQLPYARVITGQPKLIQIIVYYVVLYVGVYRITRPSNGGEIISGITNNEHTITRDKRKRCTAGRNSRMLTAIMGSGILMLILFWPKSHPFEIDMLDVGQGDGIYLSSGDGMHYFIDGGSLDVSKVGEYRILPFLKKRGIRQIDYWFVSHCDADHVSGLIEALECGYDIDTIVFSDKVVNCENYRSILQCAKATGTRVCYMTVGDSVKTKSSDMTCVYPGEDFVSEDANEASLVLMYTRGDFVGVFTGDTGSEQELEMVKRDAFSVDKVDLLKAAHHGSKNSNALEFLAYCNPDTTIISAGEDNRYGHPSPETLERMEEIDSNIYNTIEGGQITLKEIKGQIDVSYWNMLE